MPNHYCYFDQQDMYVGDFILQMLLLMIGQSDSKLMTWGFLSYHHCYSVTGTYLLSVFIFLSSGLNEGNYSVSDAFLSGFHMLPWQSGYIALDLLQNILNIQLIVQYRSQEISFWASISLHDSSAVLIQAHKCLETNPKSFHDQNFFCSLAAMPSAKHKLSSSHGFSSLSLWPEICLCQLQ